MKLRDYQRDAQDKTLDAWKDSRTCLGVLPTGGGKTVIFSSLTKRLFPKRFLIVAHRQELVFQAVKKIREVAGLNAETEMGEFKVNERQGTLDGKRASVVVASIQTLTAGGNGGGRIGKFDPEHFDYLIIDEAHHAVPGSAYERVIKYFTSNERLKVLGVTATPDRADEQALGQMFGAVAFDYEILDLIKQGWLVPVDQQMVHVESLDLNQSELAAVMEQEKPLQRIASSTIEIIGDRQGIGFASSVEHARLLSQIFNRHRRGMSAWICGTTDKMERRQIISSFAEGKIQWMWNCGVFTEGFDAPGIKVIAMGRPTKSRALYSQMCGRGLRPAENIAHKLNDLPVGMLRRSLIARSNKPSILILDFVGNSGKHKLMTTADILGGNVSDEAIDQAIIKARQSGKPVRMDKTLEEEEKLREEREKKREEEAARKARLVATSIYRTQRIDPFDILDIHPAKPRGWDTGRILSPKQREILCKQGVDPDSMEYHKAKQLVGVIFDRWHNNDCSIKQAKWLKSHGYPITLKKDQASSVMDAWAKNGWQRPDGFEIPPPTEKKKWEPKKPATQPAHVEMADDDVPF